MTNAPESDASEYSQWKSAALALRPEDMGITPENYPYPVIAVWMEVGMEEGVYALSCAADGKVSLHLSNGAATTGGGDYENVAVAMKYFMAGAQHFFEKGQLTREFPAPGLGVVLFYFVTQKGVYLREADEGDLMEGHDELSKLYDAGQLVMTELRKVEEGLV